MEIPNQILQDTPLLTNNSPIEVIDTVKVPIYLDMNDFNENVVMSNEKKYIEIVCVKSMLEQKWKVRKKEVFNNLDGFSYW